jgi:hypothetical protein
MPELPRLKDENGDVWPLIPNDHPQIKGLGAKIKELESELAEEINHRQTVLVDENDRLKQEIAASKQDSDKYYKIATELNEKSIERDKELAELKTRPLIADLFRCREHNKELKDELAALKEKYMDALATIRTNLVTRTPTIEEQSFKELKQELAAAREELERMKDTGSQYFDKAVTLNEKREKALAIISRICELCEDRDKSCKIHKSACGYEQVRRVLGGDQPETTTGLVTPGKTEFVELDEKTLNFEIPDDEEKEVPEISTTTTQVIQMNDGRMYLDVTDYIQANPAPMDWQKSENLHCFNTLTGNTCSCNRCKGYDPKVHPNPEKGGET